MRLPAAAKLSVLPLRPTFAEFSAVRGAGPRHAGSGDVIFDNTRVRHGRTFRSPASGAGGASTGRRHLQGCYADLDGLASAVAVLARDQAGQAGRDERAGQAGS